MSVDLERIKRECLEIIASEGLTVPLYASMSPADLVTVVCRMYPQAKASARRAFAVPDLSKALEDVLFLCAVKYGDRDADANRVMDKAVAVLKATQNGDDNA